MSNTRSIHIMEEFTRFGGGQTVFESVYNALSSASYNVGVITDRHHPYLPKYIPSETVIETRLSDPNWANPTGLYPTIHKLKRELRRTVPDGLTFNNHPNVFIFNATINFAPEIFGFMYHNPTKSDSLKIALVKKSGLFREYNGSYFLTTGDFTARQIKDTFFRLGLSNVTIETMDLPVPLPEEVDLVAKDRIILTFGRISPDKMLENVLEIAQIVPEVRFIIAGRVLDSDISYLNELNARKSTNVSIVPNPNLETKENLFRKSKVYLHSKKNENYGISVAEAISYGCYPVVPREGGSYEDILEGGKFGLGYSNKEEAAASIMDALDSPLSEVQNIFQIRHRFSPENFRSNLLGKIESLA